MFDQGFVKWLTNCSGVDCTLANFWQAIVGLINLAIQFSGIVAVVMLIIGGYQMMAAGISGDKGLYTEGKEKIGNVFWGLLIIFTSYVVVNTVMTIILDVTTWTTPWVNF